MVAVPGVTPVTIPVEEPTVATAALLVIQEPPGTGSFSVMVPPVTTVVLPVIGASALTVNVTVAILVPTV